VIAKVTDEDLKYLGKILDDWGSGYGDSSDLNYFESFAKKIDPSFREWPHEVYRGQSLDEDELQKIEDGGKYEIQAGSWSVEEDEAKRFAQGHRDNGAIGIVFSYTPKDNEVIINLWELAQDKSLMKHTPQATVDTLRTEGEILIDSVTVDTSNLYVGADEELDIF